MQLWKWQRVRFDTDRLKLEPGRRYVLFISIAEDRRQRPSFVSYELSRPASYRRGRLMTQTGYGARTWTEKRWEHIEHFGDMAFRMRLTN